MQSLSSLLGKSKKNVVFQQAYILSKFKEGLADLQLTNYSNLEQDFADLQIFIIEKNKNFVIKIKSDCNSFKTFLKTELNIISTELHNFFVEKGLGQIQFDIQIV